MFRFDFGAGELDGENQSVAEVAATEPTAAAGTRRDDSTIEQSDDDCVEISLDELVSSCDTTA